ncbi:D-alanyl-D-alanine carboxypeptidase family protein [Pandoraea apista]|uniref:D-alanyl-D-alanine carboxypeptidase n=1 Tax=Pandoraea apista TaxID=93218 RepID=A0A5E5PE81_9BURK|nr:D-alanyl-D-alanine carboxypeptidase [Pandoraea apista]OXS96824.1 hypothetical protein B7H01_04030 [Pandoraea apista]VVG73939.1 D-alanyl-D-alanine carboxypeptidase [Pandoraea apista]
MKSSSFYPRTLKEFRTKTGGRSKSFTYNKIHQANRNRLLYFDPTVDGLKTGHTKEAGYCLVSTALRLLPGDGVVARRVLSVVVGEPTESARVRDSLAALNYGYQNFNTLCIYVANQAFTERRVWKGEGKWKFGLNRDAFVTVPRGAAKKIESLLELRELLVAPVFAGDVVGRAKVMIDGRQLAEFPVVALANVPQASFVGRAAPLCHWRVGADLTLRPCT